MENKENRDRGGLNIRLGLAIAACALGSSFQHGYNIGVVNAPQQIISQFINLTHYERTNEYLSTEAIALIWSWAVSIFCVGGVIGAMSTGFIANKFGRKTGLLWNNVTLFIGAALEGFSKTAGSYEMLILGRFFIGINCGLNAGLAPLFVSEIAPVKLRGALGSVYQLVVTISILLSQLISLESVLGTEDNWPWALALTAVPAIIQVFTLPFCPESPKYTLINLGKEIEASEGLAFYRGTIEVTDEIEEMRVEAEAMKSVKRTGLKEMFTSAYLRKPLIIACMMMLAQQFSGINAVIFYSTEIFRSVGLSDSASQYATLGMGAMNVAMTVISLVLVEKAGRKSLMMIGLSGMFIDVILLFFCLLLKDKGDWIAYLSIALVNLFVIMFATGPGSIPWFLVTELFNQSARPTASSIAVAVNWSANFIVSIAFLPLQIAMGPYVFIIFAVLLVFFIAFVHYKVPETKNKTIEEISTLFRHQGYQ